MPQLPPRILRISQQISHLLEENRDAVDAAKLTCRILRHTKQLEFCILSRDRSGNVRQSMHHTVNLTDADHDHLLNGGKIVAVYACGYQHHFQL